MITEVIQLYEDRKEVTLTAYVLEDSPEMLNGKKRPAILICPGGAYLSCSDREAEPVAMRFASMGYHAFVLRYSTYGEGKQEFLDFSKPLPIKEHCQHPMPMLEIGKALFIIRDHAEKWSVDTDKLILCGFSAGAHNAAMYATNWHTQAVAQHFYEEKEILRPAALILGYTLSDYVYMKESFERGASAYAELFKVSNTAFLGDSDPSDACLDSVSPARHVTENTPPTFLWATAADEMVPVQHSLRMAHALADKKIPFEMHIFEEGSHGLSLSTQASAGAKTQIYPNAAKWIDFVGGWLEKRFALHLPDKTPYEELYENN